MELTKDQEQKVNQVIDKLTSGNPLLKDSPSTKVMAVNLLNTFNWDIDKALESLG